MIQTQILQYLHKDKPVGISQGGGYMRMMLASLAKAGYTFTIQDATDSLNYLLSQENMVEIGWFGRERIYSYKRR